MATPMQTHGKITIILMVCQIYLRFCLVIIWPISFVQFFFFVAIANIIGEFDQLTPVALVSPSPRKSPIGKCNYTLIPAIMQAI